MREWKETSHNVWYYWTVGSGQIVGQINNITHTDIYTAKAIVALTEEEQLGRYINAEYARLAVEKFWYMHDKTLRHEGLLDGN